MEMMPKQSIAKVIPSRHIAVQSGAQLRVWLPRKRASGQSNDILFLHGILSDSIQQWSSTIAELPKDFYPVLVDAIAHGSTTAADGDETLTSYSNDIVDLIGRLRLQSPILVGHSMGGAVALFVARRIGAGLGGVVLCSTPERFATTPAQRLKFTALMGLNWSMGYCPSFAKQHLLDASLWMFGSRLTSKPSAVLDTEALLPLAASLGSFDCRDWISQLETPIATIVTLNDATVDTKSQRSLAKRSNSCLALEISGGHEASNTSSATFAALVVRACKRIAGAHNSRT